MDEELKTYLLYLLTELGQMNHPKSLEHDKDRLPETQKAITLLMKKHDGFMLMPIEIRRELIAKGFELLKGK